MRFSDIILTNSFQGSFKMSTPILVIVLAVEKKIKSFNSKYTSGLSQK